jgi:hypothetical protein
MDEIPDLSSLLFLKVVILNNNNIKKLDFNKFPSTVNILYIEYNNLTKIDNIPKNIKSLYCRNNHIKFLNLIGSQLSYLDCSYNIILNFDFFPPTLKFLFCYNNYLSKLDNLPESIIGISCKNNNLIDESEDYWKGISKNKRLFFKVKYGRKLTKLFYKFIKAKKYDLHNELIYKPENGFYKLYWNKETLDQMKISNK